MSDAQPQQPIQIDQRMLDQFRLLERSGRPGALAQMVRMFLSSSVTQIAAIEAASAASDAEKLRVTSHTLKSNAGSFGATALAELCLEIETSARTGNGSLSPTMLEALRSVHRASCAALEREIA